VQAAFLRPGDGAARPVEYGQAVWDGVFDAAYTRPGDYLVRRRDKAVWFAAAQQELLPVMCVRAERVVGFVRPGGGGGFWREWVWQGDGFGDAVVCGMAGECVGGCRRWDGAGGVAEGYAAGELAGVFAGGAGGGAAGRGFDE
jgi:hypothetical protein